MDDPDAPDNLVESSDCSEEGILRVLRKRFERKQIRARIGDIEIAVNPNGSSRSNESTSCSFSTADSAYESIREGSLHQNIIFSGESGSGKTHNAFAILEYLAETSISHRQKITGKTISALHVVLSSFGSAKTMKNEAATRAGYVVDLQYRSSSLEGLAVRSTFPIDLSRLASRPTGERNFAVLHEMCAGLDDHLRASVGIKPDHKFFYLSNNSGDTCRDSANFNRLLSALEELGFTEDQRACVFSVLAAILHLGNIYYSTQKASSEEDPQTGSEAVVISNEGELKWIAMLLGVEAKRFAPLLVSKKTKSEDGSGRQSLSMDQALDLRDSLASFLYEEVFNWILNRISFFHKCCDHTATISVYDQYGFERYNSNNGLEQLRINSVNECLEQCVLEEIFDRQTEMYSKENINCAADLFKHGTNSKAVDLLTRKPFGILRLLDDECKFPKASHSTFLQHCNLNHLVNPVFGKTRIKEKPEFSIHHFFGVSWYSAEGFLAGNRRTVSRDILDLLCASSNMLVSSVFRAMFIMRTKEEHTILSASSLCKSIASTIDAMKSAPCHIVRCLKSNNERQSFKFDTAIVRRQIYAYSLLPTLRFRAAGFPVKSDIDNFVDTYRCLLPSVITACQKKDEILRDILDAQGSAYQDQFQIGSTMVFMCEKLSERLKARRRAVIERSALIVQKTLRAFIARQRFIRKKQAVIRLQAAFRAWKARRLLVREKQQALAALETETKATAVLQTYHRVADDDAERHEDEISKSLLGPVKYLEVQRKEDRNAEILEDQELAWKKIQYYLPIPPDMQRPTIEPQPIEEFAARNFKGHLLEARREPIQTPFLPKANDAEFDGAVEMFKLVLKYTNDVSMATPQLHSHGRRVIQMALDDIPLRDELYVQLCNQTYCNRNKIFSERAWTLLLMAVHAFPPSILVLPMLLHYFVQQQTTLRDQLMQGLVRKIRTDDAQACRLIPGNRIEHAAFSAQTNPVVQVHLPDKDDFWVEAHPWATAEELALRVFKERGMGEPEGWSVMVETEKDVFCPNGSHFIHDAIAAIEGAGRKRREEDETDAFFHFPNERSLPPTNGRKTPVPGQRTTSLARNSPGVIRRTSFKNGDKPSISVINIPADPKRIQDDINLVESDEEEESISMDSLSSSTSSSSSEGEHDVVVDPSNPDSDYCYTIPNKATAARQWLEEPATDAFIDNNTYTTPASVPQQLPPMDSRFTQSMAPYNFMPTQAMQQVQYIQYVPMVVSQPIMGTHMIGAMPPMLAGGLPAQQLYQPIIARATPLYHQPTMMTHTSHSHQHSSSSEATDERIASAMIRAPTNGGETVMSVASRIRRMPLPSENADVHRFLDEVFQHVLPPEFDGHDSMTARHIAASIKGGQRRSVDGAQQYAPRPAHSGYHILELPRGDFNSLPHGARMQNGLPRVALNRVGGQQPIRVNRSPSSAGADPRLIHSEQLRRRNVGGPTLVPHWSSSDVEPMMFFNDYQGNKHASLPGLIVHGHAHQLAPSTDAPVYDMSGSMYGDVTGIARYGLEPPLSRLTVAESVDLPEIRSPTSALSTPIVISPMSPHEGHHLPSPTHPKPVGEVVQGAILNSEHPVPGKLINPARTFTRNQAEKEREALAKLSAKSKLLPPPVESVRVVRPKPKPAPPPLVQPLDHIPEEPEEEIVAAPTPPPPRRRISPPRRAKTPEPIPIIVRPSPIARKEREPRQEPVTPRPVTFQVPSNHREIPANEWVFDYEVDRPKGAQNMLVERGGGGQENGHSGNGYRNGFDADELPPLPVTNGNGPLIAPEAVHRSHVPAPQKAAVHAPKQPWKLTIRKMNFLPGEQLDDTQLIDQVFSQIIDDCRRAIAYRIRAVERDNVTAILKKHQVHPDQLNRQHEIPVDVKVGVIEAARSWPLYFNQIFEVIEERATENVYILLAVGESGIRLLIHNPENTQTPLTIQDHFEYSDIKDVMLEEKQLLTIRTRSNMMVHLRTEQSASIRSLIEKYLYGAAKPRRFVLATSDYVSHEPEHLSFSRGQRIELAEKSELSKGWLYGRIHNRYGIFPEQHVIPEHYDERGNHPDIPAYRGVTSPYEMAGDEGGYGYDYAEEGEGREKYTMMEFALLYYRPPRGDRRNKEWTWKEVATKIVWTDKPMQQSLLRLDGPDVNKMACDAFLCMMKFMGDEPLKRGESYTDVVYKLFMMTRKLEHLRDEVYCQIVRQTTNNHSANSESAARGWRLFSILTSFFGCTTVLKPYLMRHLQEMASDPRRTFNGTAKQCVANLQKTFKYGGRKFLLSASEIDELTKGKSMKRQVYHLPGGHKKVVNTSSVTVVEEVIKELCSELNIRSPAEQQEFTLCAIVDDKDDSIVYCANDEYILDICTELEHKHQKYAFLLKRSVWLHPLRLDSALYIDAMYFQIVPDYLTGLLVSPQNNGHFSASTLDEIATLSAYVYLADEKYRTEPLDESLASQCLPATTLLSRIVTADMWVGRIDRKLRTMNTAISVSHARAAFLEIVEKWPTFGAIFWRVLTSTDVQREIAETVLSVNRSGLRLLSGDNYRTLAEYTLSSIGPVKRFFRGTTEYVDITIRAVDRDIKITVQSDKANDIARLIGHYLFVFSNSKKTIVPLS